MSNQTTDKKVKELTKKVSKTEIEKDLKDYKLFAHLHLAQRDEKGVEKKRIKAEALKQYEELEKKFKKYEGKKAKEDANVYLGLESGTCKIAGGYAVPESIYEQFVKSGIQKHWFD